MTSGGGYQTVQSAAPGKSKRTKRFSLPDNQADNKFR